MKNTTTNLIVDLSNIKESARLKVYLPNALKLSRTIKNTKGVYLSSNQIEYLTFYISKYHDNFLSIPLYISSPGNYKMEELIIQIDDVYHVSNTLDININE